MKTQITVLLLVFVCSSTINVIAGDLNSNTVTAAQQGQPTSKKELSELLKSASNGDVDAQSELAPIFYLASFIEAINDDEIMRSQLALKPYHIPSGSMKPTLMPGDYVMANLNYYKINRPKRGDLVVYVYPEDPKKDFIHRVVAIEGDEIYMENKQLYLNKKKLVEPYIINLEKDILSKEINPRDNFGPIKVSKDSYFVMGDNRDQSYDSRFWKFVNIEAIKGKAFFVYWSTDAERIGAKIK